MNISASTARKRLLQNDQETGEDCQETDEEATADRRDEEKRGAWVVQNKSWTKEDWRKVMFRDESHFFVQEQRSQHVCRSKEESGTRDHIEQHLKHPEKRCFGVASHISLSVPFTLMRV